MRQLRFASTTSKLTLLNKTNQVQNMFSILDKNGKLTSQEFNIPFDFLTSWYKSMQTLSIMDLILYEAQRQGRISFYMTNYGEEATHLGSAAALTLDDVVFGQYREAGVLMHRGFTIDQFMNQCFSNEFDLGKGKQMPVHYGSKRLNFQTISSPLGTQLPQAAGAAYALKRKAILKLSPPAVSICYFGEGAASEGDFHAALNIASTTESPVIFFCRNNGYAISTPSSEQYRGDGIVSRGAGYGMYSIRVDGNDILAVYFATLEAKRVALSENRPVLIEAMTYRIGHHSTSDDSSAYRSKTEVAAQTTNSPLSRFRLYLESIGLWSDQQETEFKTETRKKVLASFENAEKQLKPRVSEMFGDVYDQLPPLLNEQKMELENLMKQYPDMYPKGGFKV